MFSNKLFCLYISTISYIISTLLIAKKFNLLIKIIKLIEI